MKILLFACALLLSCQVLSLEYQVVKNGEFNRFTAINIDTKLQQQSFENNFTFNNHFTLHHSEHFNLLVTANITQTTTFEKMAIPDNTLIPKTYLSINETRHQYGLIGSYSLTPEWQISGGLIYSKPTTIVGNDHGSINNQALIGTSYSF